MLKYKIYKILYDKPFELIQTMISYIYIYVEKWCDKLKLHIY
jgi:hypothetical protein